MNFRICTHSKPQGECPSCVADRARFDAEKHKEQEREIEELYESVMPKGSKAKVVGVTPERDTFLISITLPGKGRSQGVI